MRSRADCLIEEVLRESVLGAVARAGAAVVVGRAASGMTRAALPTAGRVAGRLATKALPMAGRVGQTALRAASSPTGRKVISGAGRATAKVAPHVAGALAAKKVTSMGARPEGTPKGAASIRGNTWQGTAAGTAAEVLVGAGLLSNPTTARLAPIAAPIAGEVVAHKTDDWVNGKKNKKNTPNDLGDDGER